MSRLQYSKSSISWSDPEEGKMSRKKAMEYKSKGFLVQHLGTKHWRLKLVHVFVVFINGSSTVTIDMREQICHHYQVGTITEAVYQKFEYDATNHLIEFELNQDGEYQIV